MLRPLRRGHALRVRVWCVLLLARVLEGGVARARAVVRCRVQKRARRVHDVECKGVRRRAGAGGTTDIGELCALRRARRDVEVQSVPEGRLLRPRVPGGGLGPAPEAV